jgi:cell division protease FtsH
MIDEEVRKLIDVAYEKTKALLENKRTQVEKLAEALLDKEVLFQSDVETLIGKRPYEEKKIHVVDVDDASSGNGVSGPVISNPVPGVEDSQP